MEDDFIGSKFGDLEQLTVIGWFGELACTNKKYTVECSICKQDPELFGDGRFLITKNKVYSGRIPCGCSKSPKLTKEQYKVLCRRKANELGFEFLSFSGNWNGQKTKMNMFCENHGCWSTTSISSLLHRGNGCTECGDIRTREAKKNDDDVVIERFLNTGAFHPETKFWRSSRESVEGSHPYWFVDCPACGEVVESKLTHLYKGSLPCLCGSNKQKISYIVQFSKDGEKFLKFGISSNLKKRLRNLKRSVGSAKFEKLLRVFEYKDKNSCWKSETECLQNLECGIVGKDVLSSGYTETTSIENLNKIIEIFTNNGGVEVERRPD